MSNSQIRDILITPSPHAVACQVAGETVILDTASGQYFALNATGTAIWNGLSTPCSLREICDSLVSRYNVSREICENDVTALLEQLSALELVTCEVCATD